ncbi:hypothetical protein SNE40_005066 [Patella caerulea]|uniref:DDE Tnp4 domain-containing protein n=1 Tax=Patella caerulea TaxID=87958 RepID=A0AAN8QDA2_PATCE
MPETEEGWLKISEQFQKKWNFPNVLGAIDGKHIPLMTPPKSGSLFYNYKHFFSIVLMALVHGNYKSIYVEVGCNGRFSDGGVFAGCTLVEALNKRLANIPKIAPLPNTNELVSFHILGDEAFPLREDLLTPFPFRNMSSKQRIFNYRLSRARRVVENAFDILCSRFRLFLNRIALSPEKVELLVILSCALHNFLKESKSNLGSAETVNCETKLTSLQSLRLPYINNSTIVSKEKRYRLMEYFSSGSVEWQESMI